MSIFLIGSNIVLQAIDADEHFVQSAAVVVQQGCEYLLLSVHVHTAAEGMHCSGQLHASLGARGGRVCGNVLDCV